MGPTWVLSAPDGPHIGPMNLAFWEMIKMIYIGQAPVMTALFMTILDKLCHWWLKSINTLRPRRNGRYFADDVLKCIFLNENMWILLKIPLKFVPKGPINNIPALVQIITWHRPGDKPLSEAMSVFVPTHICVIRPQWVNCANDYTILYTMLIVWVTTCGIIFRYL